MVGRLLYFICKTDNPNFKEFPCNNYCMSLSYNVNHRSSAFSLLFNEFPHNLKKNVSWFFDKIFTNLNSCNILINPILKLLLLTITILFEVEAISFSFPKLNIRNSSTHPIIILLLRTSITHLNITQLVGR